MSIIKILGATHFDYMQRNYDLFESQADRNWNKTVSEFVADLVVNSQDADSLDRFLRNPPPIYDGMIAEEGNKWVVKLPGWSQR